MDANSTIKLSSHSHFAFISLETTAMSSTNSVVHLWSTNGNRTMVFVLDLPCPDMIYAVAELVPGLLSGILTI